MLSAENLHGLYHLKTSLNMAKRMFQRRSFVPRDIDGVSLSLDVMGEAQQIDFGKLANLASSLEGVPRNIGELPASFSRLLDSLNWPRNFDRVSQETRRSDYPRLTLIISMVAVMIAFLALLAEPNRELILQSSGSLLIANSYAALGSLFFIIAVYATLRALGPIVPLVSIRRYWKREEKIDQTLADDIGPPRQ
jgi:lipopolysaccharide export LptBFGC system permease protein LptF